MSWLNKFKQKWQDKKLPNDDAQSRDANNFSPVIHSSNNDLYKSDDDLGYC